MLNLSTICANFFSQKWLEVSEIIQDAYVKELSSLLSKNLISLFIILVYKQIFRPKTMKPPVTV